MPPINMLIKPASSLCNLNCSYCFYHSLAQSRHTPSYGIMKEEVLETLVKKAFEYAQGVCTFAFQGGEPTLAGLDFYKKLIQLVERYNTKKVKVNYAIQTNGLAISKDWAQFLSENNFLVGISLDGPKDIHDSSRMDARGRGSYTGVMEAIALFNRYKVEYNILCVVNAYTARHIGKIYNFFKRQGFRYLQFIPCLDSLEEQPGGHEYSLTNERFAYFMKTLFNDWVKDIEEGNYISIRTFDNYVGMLLGQPPESCGMSGVCSTYFVVEADGGVYPCDFYVLDDYRLGSILENSFQELISCSAAKKFEAVSQYVDPECRGCDHYALCRGGCRRSREPFADGIPVLNHFCGAYKEFFRSETERMKKVAALVSRRRY